MAKKSMILKQQKAVPTPTSGTTASAVSASASWPIRDRSPESARPPG